MKARAFAAWLESGKLDRHLFYIIFLTLGRILFAPKCFLFGNFRFPRILGLTGMPAKAYPSFLEFVINLAARA
jgi:hypothetical protein